MKVQIYDDDGTLKKELESKAIAVSSTETSGLLIKADVLDMVKLAVMMYKNLRSVLETISEMKHLDCDDLADFIKDLSEDLETDESETPSSSKVVS